MPRKTWLRPQGFLLVSLLLLGARAGGGVEPRPLSVPERLPLRLEVKVLRLDGATKELFVWGLRCGFVTFGPGRSADAEAVCAVLDAKARGAIRGAISNSPQLSQTLVARALATSSIDTERKEKCELLRARAERVHEIAHAPRFRESWDVYPFNSGYFMCVKVKGVDAEKLRVHLLDAHQTGLISTSATDIRIAFSCLEVEQIEPLFEVLHRGIQELAGREG